MTRILSSLERLTIAYLTGWFVQHGMPRELSIALVQPCENAKNAPNPGGVTDKYNQDDKTTGCYFNL